MKPINRTLSEIQNNHTLFKLECWDRMFFTWRFPMLMSEGGAAVAIKRVFNVVVAVSFIFKPLRDMLVNRMSELAAEHETDVIWLPSTNQKKDEIATEYLEKFHATKKEEGVVCIVKAQEKQRVLGTRTEKATDGTDRKRASLYFTKNMVNQYYVYFWDKDWGLGFVKLSSYAPFGGNLYVNGHEYVKRQLEQRGIGYEALENGLKSCQRPEVLPGIVSEIGSDSIRRLFRKWTLGVIKHPVINRLKRHNVRYEIYMTQMEYARTSIWDNGKRGLEFFEQLIRENLDIGRPETAGLIFKKRATKKVLSCWKFMTQVVTEKVIPVFKFRFKSNIMKLYLKCGIGLRLEAMMNNPRDLGVRTTLTERNFAELREKGMGIISRTEGQIKLSHDPTIAAEKLIELETSQVKEGRRIGGIRRSSERDRELLNCLLKLSYIGTGITNESLREQMNAVGEKKYTSGQISYHLRKLKEKEVLKKVEGKNRYEMTKTGMHLALFITRVEKRVYREGMGTLLSGEDWGPSKETKKVKEQVKRVDDLIGKMMENMNAA